MSVDPFICRAYMMKHDPSNSLLQSQPDRDYFLQDTVDLDPSDVEAWSGESWVTAFIRNKAMGIATDPCDVATIYMICVYWAIATATSVGYGDIVATNPSEYVVASLCILASSVLWCYISGAACATMLQMNPEQIELEYRLDAFNAMASDMYLDRELRSRGREYIREERFHRQFMRNRAAVMGLGIDLKGKISHCISGS